MNEFRVFYELTLAAPRGIGVTLNPKGGLKGPTKTIVSMNLRKGFVD